MNASCEPEIIALGNMLNHMGARISGLGSPTITVEGVDRLNGVSEKVLPDRLEAGTYAIAAVVTGGEIRLDRVVERDMLPLQSKLEEAGAEIWARGDSMLVRPGRALRAVEVQTLPFPGFPTDLQAAFAVLMTQAEGVSKVKERVFDDRLRYIEQLRILGANASVEELGNGRLGNEATIIGPTPLIGASVKAIDIRAGAGMVLAGLAALAKQRCMIPTILTVATTGSCRNCKISEHGSPFAHSVFEEVSMPSRILIVEDEPSVADLIEAVLTGEGYIVAIARDGVQGLMLARDWNPDLILMDIMFRASMAQPRFEA